MTSRHPRISVGPRNAPLIHELDPVVDAVRRGGAEIVEPAEAEAIVWLAMSGADLRDVLHEGVRWVQLPSAGVEYWLTAGEIDTDRVYTSAAGAYAESVGEHAVALVLAAARRLSECAGYTDWDRDRGEGRPLRGSTVGVVGAGGIGREAIRLLAPFGVRIIAVTRGGREIPGADVSIAASQLGAYWQEFDFTVIAAPATADTAALVGERELAAMPDDAWIINIARGSLIDTDALIAALRAGTIGGAALDVTEPEPLPTGHPLWTFPNVLITPHAANPDRGSMLLRHITQNVQRFARDEELLAVVDPDAGY